MEREKVKEIKKALEFNAGCEHHDKLSYIDGYKCKVVAYADILTLINELESENEMLKATKDRLTFADRIKLVDNAVENKLKQFAERLKEKIQNCSGCYIPDCFESPTNEFAYSEIEVNKAIDETLKEFKKGKVQNYE